ncbi:hypothetical protein Acr_29g0010090 [Actinidia rufa]|uniref:Uncharacterized protein n=1 Tax=Actinidia rufa TaxID=165716 RepID=A0A7J0HFF0_9ERIC|nr:hypothetical protein Acr_29g0010090 [Actinidia rufa]
MDEIKKLGTNSKSAARAYRALCNEDPRKWTLAHDGGYRWRVITTNDSECYNNVLTSACDLPITSCVEITFYRLVATFNNKRRQIESALAKGLRYTSKVQAKLEEYQARSAGHHVTICNWASGSAEVITSAAGTIGNHKHAMLTIDLTGYENMGYGTDALACRRCGSGLYDGELDPRVLHGPWGVRWRSRLRTTTTSTYVVRVYRDQLDRLRPDEVVPSASNISPALHGIDIRGRARTDCIQFHREHINRWHRRREYLVVGVINAAAMHYDDQYMVWYQRITRTLVGNPAHQPTSGYVEIGSTIEIAVKKCSTILTKMPKRKGNFGASSSHSVPSKETVENQSSAIHVVRTYMDPVGNKWHPYVHPLGSQTTNALGCRGKTCSINVVNKRCIADGMAYVSLRPSQLRFFDMGSPNSQVINALEREIDEMQRRLDRYHFTEYAKKECIDPTQRIIEINVDPLLVSDPELSDFLEEDGDDDFVNYLPSSISVTGKPLCCYEHGP